MGNDKGNKGEREVAGLLKGWWTLVEPEGPDGDPLEFVRTPLSGGWEFGATFKACGDIMTNAVQFPFSVEVKREERWNLQRLLDGRSSPVWKFWRQCQRDAHKVGREPMLWFRQNRNPWLVMVRARYASSVAGAPAPDVVWPGGLRYQVDCQAVPVMYLGSRLLEVDPSVFAMKGN